MEFEVQVQHLAPAYPQEVNTVNAGDGKYL